MCADQTPMVISSTLSYGYAAVKLAGEQESDWCCACYELTFTSGAVQGKKMIVQATNTGGDLGSNHFDLAIPGGGVGMFNACSKQCKFFPSSLVKGTVGRADGERHYRWCAGGWVGPAVRWCFKPRWVQCTPRRPEGRLLLAL